MTREEWAGLERVLAVRMDNIGDVVLLSPALRAIRQLSPKARITLLASPAGAQAAPLLPDVAEVIAFSPIWQDASASAVARDADADNEQLRREDALTRQLYEAVFDAAVVFTSFSQSPYPPAFVCHRAGIPVRIGQSKEFGGAVLTHWTVPRADGEHQAQRNLDLIAQPDLDTRLSLSVPPAARASAETLLREVGVEDGFVLVAPGASCSARRYPRFREVCEWLDRFGAAHTLIAGGPGEVAEAEALARGVGSAISVAGRTDISSLAALVERAGAVIVNNSLALHLADAFGTPSVVLYSGAEELSQWAARNSRSVVFGSFPSCSPCHLFACPEDLRCLDISPRSVAQAAIALITTDSSAVTHVMKEVPSR